MSPFGKKNLALQKKKSYALALIRYENEYKSDASDKEILIK